MQRSGLTIAGNNPGILAPVERRRSGSVSSSQTGRSQHSSVHGRRSHKSTPHRGLSPMCCAAGSSQGNWDCGACGQPGTPFDETTQRRSTALEDVMEPVAEVDRRLSSFGWKSEGTRGSRRTRSDSRWQVRWPAAALLDHNQGYHACTWPPSAIPAGCRSPRIATAAVGVRRELSVNWKLGMSRRRFAR